MVFRTLIKSILFLLLLSSSVCMTGFMQIRDEIAIKASGGAHVKRSVLLNGAEELEKSISRFNSSDPSAELLRKFYAFRLKANLCNEITAKKNGWTSCRYEGETLIVEKSYSKDESPFSSAGDGTVSFGLHQYVQNPLTPPPVVLPQLSSSWTDGPEYLSSIEDFKKKGLRYDLSVKMPGDIKLLWGRKYASSERLLRLDMLEAWPSDRNDSFVVASAGVLGTPFFQLVAITAAVLGALVWARRMRS